MKKRRILLSIAVVASLLISGTSPLGTAVFVGGEIVYVFLSGCPGADDGWFCWDDKTDTISAATLSGARGSAPDWFGPEVPRTIPLQRKGRVSHGHALMNAPSHVPPTIGGTPAKTSNVNFGQRVYGHSTTGALASVTAASGVHVVLKTLAA